MLVALLLIALFWTSTAYKRKQEKQQLKLRTKADTNHKQED